MGEAKRRGTFEQRKKKAILRAAILRRSTKTQTQSLTRSDKSALVLAAMAGIISAPKMSIGIFEYIRKLK